MIITKLDEKKVFSQGGEDGILSAILDEIGQTTKTYIEISAGDGSECNCRALRELRGFTGVMIDRGNENELVRKRFVTAENVQRVLKELNAPEHPDVFSLDIDGVDWYVLRNLGPYLPRVLVCEYNGCFEISQCLSIPYSSDFTFCGTRYHGASALAMHKLARRLGYVLVYANPVNLFFVERQYDRNFPNADDMRIHVGPLNALPDDPRMNLMINPFTVCPPEPE